MNFSATAEINLENVKEFARNYARKKSPKASIILNVILKKPQRDYLNLCFAYLRYVDDIIDNSKIPISKKKYYTEYQKQLISASYKSSFTPSSIEESCLYYLAEYAKSNNKTILIDEINNMVKALSMDVNRLNNSIFSRCELEKYINLMSKSLFNILFTFLYPHLNLDKNIYIGKFTANAQMIRDLEEDINAGFINICKEDIEDYNLDINNLKEDPNLSKWLKDRMPILLDIMYKDILLLKYLPFKFRIFSYYSIIYYLPNVLRVKYYGYKTGKNFKYSFLRETRTYFSSFYISVNLYLKAVLTKTSNNSNKLSLKSALKRAEIFTRKRAFKSWFAARIMIPKSRVNYLFLAHYYLRWLDDFIDNINISVEKKKIFLERQLKLISSLNREFQIDLLSEEEYYLFYYIQYSKSIKNDNLIFELSNIVESINLDLNRLEKDGIFSAEELEIYIEKQTRSLFNLVYYFLIPAAYIKKQNKYIGKLNWYLLSIRDFSEDLELGFINVSTEEIKKYNLDIYNLKKEKILSNWMKEKHVELLKLLDEETVILKSMPLRIKLFWWASYLSIILELTKIKHFNYKNPGKNDKSLKQQIKIYSESIHLSGKFIFRIFS